MRDRFFVALDRFDLACRSAWRPRLARELGPYGIRANSVCPTVVLTEMGQRVWDEEAKAAPTLARIPLVRFAVPQEVADTVVWLPPDAAGMINGVDIPVGRLRLHDGLK